MKVKKLFGFLVLSFAIFFLVSCNEDPKESAGEQFRNDVNKIDNFLATNHIDAFKDLSGIRFTITTMGRSGLPPRRDHVVKLKYKGRIFASGETFENGTLDSKVNDLPVAGLVEAVEILPVGSVATVYVPSGIGYGNIDVNGIPANSILVYDIELLEVKPTTQELQQLGADSTAIDAYLSQNSIVAQKAPFGVRYVITQQGFNSVPLWYDKIKVNYTGKVLAKEEAFFSGTIEPTDNFDSRVVDFLRGLQVGFQSMPAGSKATIYVPSTLGFGTTGAGNGAVPPNANIVYEINSLQFVD
jgi:FKBP-type peptidyl-prolyl cis-trans isomerase